ncbi:MULTISPECIES: tetratricopeptide repeat protein [Cyanophyceae]|uniref:tetratricopeptide repeat protein n=1 Tax=Cyanophyceae TaxID=3028117 RepID=UPI0016842D37|nr:tetratricopeptide repeat protein [Trichocoleus sp. FACHB-40]MBD2003760.1 tetratricopeptide repeat protein [Trichocoleus sp. FACHB-40]
MKLKSHLKPAFIQPLTCISLGILAGIAIPPIVLAQPILPGDLIIDQSVFSKPPVFKGKINDNRRPRPCRTGNNILPSQHESFMDSMGGMYRPRTSSEQQDCARLRREQEARQRQREEQARKRAEEVRQLMQQWSNLYSANKLSEAEVVFGKLIEMHPKDARQYYQSGNELYGQGKAEAAIIIYQQAIRLNPRHAVAHNAIGIIRASQGRWEEAIAEYQQALSINPDYADVLKNLGQALWQQGKREDAIASLEKAKKLYTQQRQPYEVNQVDSLLQRMSG